MQQVLVAWMECEEGMIHDNSRFNEKVGKRSAEIESSTRRRHSPLFSPFPVTTIPLGINGIADFASSSPRIALLGGMKPLRNNPNKT